ncbi:MAG TPA: DUF4097 family beta strand repeat-containing protein [Vicinamibacteria bacterium]
MSTKALVGRGLVAVWAVAASACVVGGPLTARDTTVETRDLDPGGRFSLENVNGRVTLTTWDEPRVRIEADRAARTEEALRELRVEIEGDGRRVSVRTRTPRGFRFGRGGGRVDYQVTVPADAEVRVSTVNGRIEIEGVAGAVRASATNGGVEIRGAAGEVDASVVNGRIDARYRVLDPDAHHRFSVTNGSIAVAVPEGTGGRLEAQTVNGGVDSDLELESTERTSRRRLEGRLGNGRGSLELSTVNGGIRLRRS